MRTSPKDTTWRRKFEIMAHMNAAPRARARCFEGDRCHPRPQLTFGELSTDGRAVVGHSIDRAVVVVGDQHRAVLEDQQVSRASEIIVVFNEARDERIGGFHRTVLVERHHDDVAAEMLISDDYNGAVYRDRQAVFQLCAILSLS